MKLDVLRNACDTVHCISCTILTERCKTAKYEIDFIIVIEKNQGG